MQTWSESIMYSRVYLLKDDLLDSTLFKLEVLFEGFEETNQAKLCIAPLDKEVSIVHEIYNDDNTLFDVFNIGNFKQDIDFNEEKEVFEIAIKTGFDVFIFNICALLEMGKLTIDEDVKPSKNGFAPIQERVKSITLNMKEFNALDGYVCECAINEDSFDFKGLVINCQGIHESVKSGAYVPDFESDVIMRGEDLSIWD